MQQAKLWKKELILIIIIGILILWIFLAIKINWAKNTAKEKWNEIKESTLIETNSKDESAKTDDWEFSYSVFHEWKAQKEEEDTYDFDSYNYENYDYNIDDDYNYEDDNYDEYNETY